MSEKRGMPGEGKRKSHGTAGNPCLMALVLAATGIVVEEHAVSNGNQCTVNHRQNFHSLSPFENKGRMVPHSFLTIIKKYN